MYTINFESVVGGREEDSYNVFYISTENDFYAYGPFGSLAEAIDYADANLSDVEPVDEDCYSADRENTERYNAYCAQGRV